jgi:hypothetical protein
MKPLVLDPLQWENLQQRLNQDYPRSVMLLRSKRREVLGFTERYHRQWIAPKGGITGYYRKQVHLDFFDYAKRTFFTLKYGEFLEKG